MFVRLSDVLRVHERAVMAYGGASAAVRDMNTLQSALARPENYLAYENPNVSLFTLAALYGRGLARAHAFVDGNKRTAFLVMCLFLEIHDLVVVAAEDEAITLMEAVATGEVDESGIAKWLREHVYSADTTWPPIA